jgi:threonyl-tRNA synthetase
MYKGAFPTWLAPKQVTIIPVKDDLHGEYADKLREQMACQDIRVEVDHRNEKMGYKIREAQTRKVPYTFVVGDKEMASNAVSVRRYGEDNSQTVSVDQFMQDIKADIDSYSRKN